MSEYYAPVDYYGQEDREDDEEGLIIDEQAPTATTSQSNLAVNSGVSRKHLDPIVQEYYTGQLCIRFVCITQNLLVISCNILKAYTFSIISLNC